MYKWTEELTASCGEAHVDKLEKNDSAGRDCSFVQGNISACLFVLWDFFFPREILCGPPNM